MSDSVHHGPLSFHFACLALGALAALGCQGFDELEPGTCGNEVVEREIGETCEVFVDGCFGEDSPFACRLDCSESSECPEGQACQPTGQCEWIERVQAAICGNGILEPESGESCEFFEEPCIQPGEANQCLLPCQVSSDCPENAYCGDDKLCRPAQLVEAERCGNGVLDAGLGETCESGQEGCDTKGAFACRLSCAVTADCPDSSRCVSAGYCITELELEAAVCGNDLVEPFSGETCEYTTTGCRPLGDPLECRLDCKANLDCPGTSICGGAEVCQYESLDFVYGESIALPDLDDFWRGFTRDSDESVAFLVKDFGLRSVTYKADATVERDWKGSRLSDGFLVGVGNLVGDSGQDALVQHSRASGLDGGQLNGLGFSVHRNEENTFRPLPLVTLDPPGDLEFGKRMLLREWTGAGWRNRGAYLSGDQVLDFLTAETLIDFGSGGLVGVGRWILSTECDQFLVEKAEKLLVYAHCVSPDTPIYSVDLMLSESLARVTDGAVRDVDGDGLPDLWGRIGGRLSVFSGDGNGNFTKKESLDISSGEFGVLAMELTGDGKLDWVAVDANAGFDHVVYLSEIEDFPLPSDRIVEFLGHNYIERVATNWNEFNQSRSSGPPTLQYGDEIADFNVDGREDIADFRGVHLSQGNGNVTTVYLHDGVLSGFRDLNGDGIPDLISQESSEIGRLSYDLTAVFGPFDVGVEPPRQVLLEGIEESGSTSVLVVPGAEKNTEADLFVRSVGGLFALRGQIEGVPIPYYPIDDLLQIQVFEATKTSKSLVALLGRAGEAAFQIFHLNESSEGVIVSSEAPVVIPAAVDETTLLAVIDDQNGDGHPEVVVSTWAETFVATSCGTECWDLVLAPNLSSTHPSLFFSELAPNYYQPGRAPRFVSFNRGKERLELRNGLDDPLTEALFPLTQRDLLAQAGLEPIEVEAWEIAADDVTGDGLTDFLILDDLRGLLYSLAQRPAKVVENDPSDFVAGGEPR